MFILIFMHTYNYAILSRSPSHYPPKSKSFRAIFHFKSKYFIFFQISHLIFSKSNAQFSGRSSKNFILKFLKYFFNFKIAIFSYFTISPLGVSHIFFLIKRASSYYQTGNAWISQKQSTVFNIILLKNLQFLIFIKNLVFSFFFFFFFFFFFIFFIFIIVIALKNYSI